MRGMFHLPHQRTPAQRCSVYKVKETRVPFPTCTLFKCIAAAHATLHAAMLKSHVPAYRPNSICSHALVAAEKCGDLDCLLKWGVSQAKSYNFTSLATVKINTRSSGRKSNCQRQNQSQKRISVVMLLTISG